MSVADADPDDEPDAALPDMEVIMLLGALDAPDADALVEAPTAEEPETVSVAVTVVDATPVEDTVLK